MLLLECLLGLIRFLLGAALFSFMNVVAWRLPRDMDPLKGRSICPPMRPHAGGSGLGAGVQLAFSARALPPLRCADSGAVLPGGGSGRRAGAGLYFGGTAQPTACRRDFLA